MPDLIIWGTYPNGWSNARDISAVNRACAVSRRQIFSKFGGKIINSAFKEFDVTDFRFVLKAMRLCRPVIRRLPLLTQPERKSILQGRF
jgi:hypothetical protein